MKYLGPYIVTKSIGKGSYALQLVADSTKIIKSVNGAHLKPYSTPPASPSQSPPPFPSHSMLKKRVFQDLSEVQSVYCFIAS